MRINNRRSLRDRPSCEPFLLHAPCSLNPTKTEGKRKRGGRGERLGYSRERGSSGYKQSRAHYFARFPPRPPPSTHASLFFSPLRKRPPRSFFLFSPQPSLPRRHSSTVSFSPSRRSAPPSSRHRRAIAALIYLHPHAPAFSFSTPRHSRLSATVCPHTIKLTQRDLHRLAFRSELALVVLVPCANAFTRCPRTSLSLFRAIPFGET